MLLFFCFFLPSEILFSFLPSPNLSKSTWNLICIEAFPVWPLWPDFLLIFKMQELNWVSYSFLFFIMRLRTRLRLWYCSLNSVGTCCTAQLSTLILCLVLSFHINVGILRTGTKNWTNAVLFVFIICTIVAFEYIEEYFSCFVGSVFLIESWMMVGIQIGVLDFTMI